MEHFALLSLSLSLLWTLVTSAPTRCCMSHQFYVHVTDPRLINMHQYETATMFFDFDSKMAAVQNFRFQPNGPATPTVRVVQDFNKKKWFTIDPDGSCSVRDVKMDMYPRCVPDSAAFLGTSYLGRNDGSRLYYDAWHMPLAGSNANSTLTLLQDGCVPNILAIRGDIGGEAVDSVYVYTTFEEGIADKSVFDVPSSCVDVLSTTVG